MTNKLETLTKQELAILKLIARGYTNREICSKLFIENTTLKTHVNHIYGKLGLLHISKKDKYVKRTKAALYYLECTIELTKKNKSLDLLKLIQKEIGLVLKDMGELE